jgi:polar amino acid transport system substrate-binding protein
MTDEIARSRAALLPKGYLRAAINLANIALVGGDPATGKFEGVSVELARDLSKRLCCRVEFVTYPSWPPTPPVKTGCCFRLPTH